MTEPAIPIETATETTSTATPQNAAGEDRIRNRAYELYEKRNGAPGDAESDWYRAEAELENGAEAKLENGAEAK